MSNHFCPPCIEFFFIEIYLFPELDDLNQNIFFDLDPMYISFLCTVTSSLVHSVHIARVAVQMYMCPIGNVEVWFYFIFTFSSINLVWIVIQQVKHVFFVLWVQYYFITFVCFFLTYSTFFGAVKWFEKITFFVLLVKSILSALYWIFFFLYFFPQKFDDLDPKYIFRRWPYVHTSFMYGDVTLGSFRTYSTSCYTYVHVYNWKRGGHVLVHFYFGKHPFSLNFHSTG